MHSTARTSSRGPSACGGPSRACGRSPPWLSRCGALPPRQCRLRPRTPAWRPRRGSGRCRSPWRSSR
eukprot:2539860-Pyramimonas_sp.AAC.1